MEAHIIPSNEARLARQVMANLYRQQKGALRFVEAHPVTSQSTGLLDLIGCWLSGL